MPGWNLTKNIQRQIHLQYKEMYLHIKKYQHQNMTETYKVLYLISSLIWSGNTDCDKGFNSSTRSIQNVDIQMNAEHPLDSQSDQ